MPRAQCLIFLRHSEANERREIDGRKQHDVSHRVTATIKKLPAIKRAVKLPHHGDSAQPLRLAKLGELRLYNPRGEGMGMRPHHADRHHQPHLDAPDPHIDLGNVLCTNTEQRGFRMQPFKIAANRDALRQHACIIEYEARRLTKRIDLEIVFTAVLTGGNRHVRRGNTQPLLGKKDTHAPGIWCRIGGIIEQHGDLAAVFRISRMAFRKLLA